MNLTTLARVKALAEQAGPANDAWFNLAIAGKSLAIEREIDRFVEKKSYTEKFDPDGTTRRFWLQGPPVTAITEVRNGGTVYAATGYRLGPEADMVEFLVAPVKDFDGLLEIDYAGGLAVDADELVGGDYADLAFACELEVLSLWQRRKQLAEQVSESVGGSTFSVTKSMPLLPETKAMLERFRLGA